MPILCLKNNSNSIAKVCLGGESACIYSVQSHFYSNSIYKTKETNPVSDHVTKIPFHPFQGTAFTINGVVSRYIFGLRPLFDLNMKVLHLLLTLASTSFSMSSLDVENSLRVILGVLSPWPTEPIISCSFSWFTSAYMLIQGIFL